MTAKDLMKNTLGTANWLTTEYLKDFSDADLLIRFAPSANHTAWQLGHLIISERHHITALGLPMPELPAGFEAAHSKENAKSDDPKMFGTKDSYLALLSKMHEGVRAAIDKTPDADLDKPAPEAMRSYAPTVADALNISGLHEMMHGGQFVAVRRKLNKPIMF